MRENQNRLISQRFSAKSTQMERTSGHGCWVRRNGDQYAPSVSIVTQFCRESRLRSKMSLNQKPRFELGMGAQSRKILGQSP